MSGVAGNMPDAFLPCTRPPTSVSRHRRRIAAVSSIRGRASAASHKLARRPPKNTLMTNAGSTESSQSAGSVCGGCPPSCCWAAGLGVTSESGIVACRTCEKHELWGSVVVKHVPKHEATPPGLCRPPGRPHFGERLGDQILAEKFFPTANKPDGPVGGQSFVGTDLHNH